MNDEVKRLQEKMTIGNMKVFEINNVKRLSEDMISHVSRRLNTILYFSDMDYTDSIVALMGYVMSIFAGMGVYPDYFFERIMPNYFERRIKIEEIEKGNNESYRAERSAKDRINTEYKAKSEETINEGVNKRYHKMISRTITEQYQRVVKVLEGEGIICGVLDDKRAYKIVEKRCAIQITKYYSISDDVCRDIAYLIRLLCECFFYFALIGKDPTNMIQKFIDEYDYKEELNGSYYLREEINTK